MWSSRVNGSSRYRKPSAVSALTRGPQARSSRRGTFGPSRPAARCRSRERSSLVMTKDRRSFEPRSSAFGLRCLLRRGSSIARPLSVLPIAGRPAESGGTERGVHGAPRRELGRACSPGDWLREDGRRKHRRSERSERRGAQRDPRPEPVGAFWLFKTTTLPTRLYKHATA